MTQLLVSIIQNRMAIENTAKEYIPGHIIQKNNVQTVGLNLTPDTFESSNDIKLLDKCLNHSPRYRIPDHLRQKMVDKLEKLTDSQFEKHQIKAIQTLIKLDEVNVEIYKALKPKRVEQTITNVTKLSDQELMEALKNVQKLLPPIIGA